ncbi:DUF1858 domain-containing protein [Crassaminicella thermophila]|uniref:DUF1858 domain-containing protein n=1 Tax=Crassaminicella thermophila TaxID=2599308 RepID=A0A5C0SJY4_CRATE|nr:DUF1858 domain-containing protein [Crassaminicella thermophila]QEK13498.1 DUF1858 domain-containing protein [Crassaminicella thermophila]
MAKITKDMIIADVLQMDRGLAPIFMRHGLTCLGCPASAMETIADVSVVHGMDPDALVKDLNEYLENKEK